VFGGQEETAVEAEGRTRSALIDRPLFANGGKTMFTTTTLRLFALLSGIRARFEDDEGQTLAEYGLIVTTIAVAVVILAVIAFRGALIASFNSAGACLNGSC